MKRYGLYRHRGMRSPLRKIINKKKLPDREAENHNCSEFVYTKPMPTGRISGLGLFTGSNDFLTDVARTLGVMGEFHGELTTS